MKNKKGFISTSIIYSFFLVFILLMIAFLMSFANKRFLNDKIGDKYDPPGGEIEFGCSEGDTLAECLIKGEYVEYEKTKESPTIKNSYLVNVDKDSTEVVNLIKEEISKRATPDFSLVATTEEGMFTTSDNDGVSYYYRGAEDDNYVDFAGHKWRVVRINGDGSIRIILQDNIGSDYFNNIDWSSQGTTWFAYQGYMNSGEFWAVGINRYKNNESSTIKNKIDNWYKTNINSYNTYLADSIFCGDKNALNDNEQGVIIDKYDEYKNVLGGFFSNNGLSIATHLQTYFVPFYRLIYDSSVDPRPSLICDYSSGNEIITDNSIYNLSSYNVSGTDFKPMTASNWTNYGYSKQAIFSACQEHDLPCFDQDKDECIGGWKGIKCKEWSYKPNYRKYNNEKLFLNEILVLDNALQYKRNIGNGKLTYPIGTINSDEVAMAGGVFGKNNLSYYLNDDNTTVYWTMSLGYIDNNGYNNETVTNFQNNIVYDGGSSKNRSPYYFGVNEKGAIQMISSRDNTAAIRPVVNLKSDVLFCDGDGSKSNPYKVGNGSCS